MYTPWSDSNSRAHTDTNDIIGIRPPCGHSVRCTGPQKMFAQLIATGHFIKTSPTNRTYIGHDDAQLPLLPTWRTYNESFFQLLFLHNTVQTRCLTWNKHIQYQDELQRSGNILMRFMSSHSACRHISPRASNETYVCPIDIYWYTRRACSYIREVSSFSITFTAAAAGIRNGCYSEMVKLHTFVVRIGAKQI